MRREAKGITDDERSAETLRSPPVLLRGEYAAKPLRPATRIIFTRGHLWTVKRVR